MRRNRTMSVASNFVKEENAGQEQVTQIGSDHYMIRRRDTKIFFKGFPSIVTGNEAKTEEDCNETSGILQPESQQDNHSLSWLLSGIYALLVVIGGLMMKAGLYITKDITTAVVDCFLIVLYSIGIVFMVCYHPLATRCYHYKEKITFAKSNHVNNRWLKGVLALFGLAIIIKDGLELIGFLNIDNVLCTEEALYSAVPVVHSLFIISQVKYIFRYSKVFTQQYQAVSRLGVMHVIATNLVIWVGALIDELAASLSNGDDSHNTAEITEDPHHFADGNSSDLDLSMKSNTYASSHEAILFPGNCTCTVTFCSTISMAEVFLYPFVVEFSLVACCLLYVTWRNVGKIAPICEHVVKPSYKLYRSYTGVATGSLSLLCTILIIVFIGSTSSGVPSDQRSYFTEYKNLILYNTFTIIISTAMTIVCGLGLYLFRKISHKISKAESGLDAILLLVCVIGPITTGFFSILAVIAGDDNKISGWLLTFGAPLSVMLQCVCQIIFILYGLKREPIISEEGQETAAVVQQQQLGAVNLAADYDEESGNIPKTSEVRRGSFLLRPHPFHLAAHLQAFNAGKSPSSAYLTTNPLHELKEENRSVNSLQSAEENKEVFESDGDSTSLKQFDSGVEASSSKAETTFNQHIISEEDLKGRSTSKAQTDLIPAEDDGASIACEAEMGLKVIKRNEENYRNPMSGDSKPVQIVAETKVAHPDKTRLLLRNVVMFLLITNASLWVFTSLEETAFVVYLYEELYYGESTWTALYMICRPLSIFFRMHSAACLFEIWSFA
ncbi:unnamed protein product [Clavelina lepadiformis]|uniref:Uncharacterized protein n=1 Tax=Clavelina lepadiformis TaxID=159417 RepID=A0ABP0FVS0_CLALP